MQTEKNMAGPYEIIVLDLDDDLDSIVRDIREAHQIPGP